MTHATPFPADAAVEEEMKAERMIQAAAPLAWRGAEMEYVMKALGLEDRITSFPIPDAPEGED